MAIGAGFALGAGDDALTIGLRFFYAIDFESLNSVDLTIFLRYYILNNGTFNGLFLQLNAGACIFGVEKAPNTPAESGSISIGLLAGWRFPLGKRWHIEPFIRAGYPYKIGVGVSAAYRF